MQTLHTPSMRSAYGIVGSLSQALAGRWQATPTGTPRIRATGATALRWTDRLRLLLGQTRPRELARSLADETNVIAAEAKPAASERLVPHPYY
jgi:hypothetical protein